MSVDKLFAGAGIALFLLSQVASAQAAPASPAMAASQPSDPLRPYRINPGDQLSIYVWGEERLQRDVNVLPDGTFAFPLVGQVNALGKLPAEIEVLISQGLRSEYRDTVPKVTVAVKAPSGMTFTVAGKVRSPGAFTPGRYVNVLEAVALAGGPADFADLGSVAILRKQGGRLLLMKVRLTDFLKGSPGDRDLTGLPQLESGDSVIVP